MEDSFRLIHERLRLISIRTRDKAVAYVVLEESNLTGLCLGLCNGIPCACTAHNTCRNWRIVDVKSVDSD